MTEKLKQATETYYSREDPRYIAWKKYCEMYPDSLLLEPTDKPFIKLVRFPLTIPSD